MAATPGDLRWYHRIELPDGTVTPGRSHRNTVVAAALDRVDVAGRSVLDVGCADGLWAFELECRGASRVVAVDDRHRETFEVAARALGSRVEYRPRLSVYDISLVGDRFDVVLFAGVYYHLDHPLLALERLRDVVAPGGTLIVEGEVSWLPWPAARFYRGGFRGNRTSVWIPSRRCLRDMIAYAGFDLAGTVRSRWPRWRRRYAVIARVSPAPPGGVDGAGVLRPG